MRQELRLDADSVVAHANGDAAAIDDDVELDGAAVGRVLRGVVQHVAEDLAQARKVAKHPDRRLRHLHGQRVALRVDERPNDLDAVLENLAELHGLAMPPADKPLIVAGNRCKI